MYPSPVLGDLNKNGLNDIVYTCHNGVIKAYRGATNESQIFLWQYEDNFGKEIFLSNPALADLNKDGISDVVIGGESGKLYIINGQTGEPFYISETKNPITTTPVIGDIDNDYFIDILCLTKNFNVVKYKTNAKVLKTTVIWKQKNNDCLHSGQLFYSLPDTRKFYIVLIFSFAVILCIILLNVRKHFEYKKMIAKF